MKVEVAPGVAFEDPRGAKPVRTVPVVDAMLPFVSITRIGLVSLDDIHASRAEHNAARFDGNRTELS